MNNIFFAHAGHLHTETINKAGFTLSYTTIMWLVLGICIASIFIVSHFLLKKKLDTTLFALGLFLTAYGIVTSAHPGPYSAIGLLGGLATAIALARVRLTALQQ